MYVLGLILCLSNIGSFWAGRETMARQATEVINEANRRIAHLNARLADALGVEVPKVCAAPNAKT